ncbi:TPA: TrfB-related DNA-binding protein [Burkholderia orbicola]
MKLTRLTAEDFDHVVQQTRMGDLARDMARAVLVDGRPQTDVAVEYGRTRQRVSAAVGQVERAFAQWAKPGTGWVRVTLDLPEALALELANLSEALKGGKKLAREKALEHVLGVIRTANGGLKK